MLLKDVFIDAADLEATLRKRGDRNVVPYFLAVHQEEEMLLRHAVNGTWVGVGINGRQYDITEPDTFEVTRRRCDALKEKNKRTYCYIQLDSAQIWLDKVFH